MSRASWSSVFLSVLMLLAGPLAAEEITSLQALFKTKKAHDGKYLCIQGRTATLFQKYSHRGNHYYTVWINQGADKIKVFGFGFPAFAEGEIIEACGRYQEIKKVSGRIFYDEFTASAILKGPAMHSGRVKITPKGVQTASEGVDVPKEAPAKPR